MLLLLVSVAALLRLASSQAAPSTLLVYYSDTHQDNVVLVEASAKALDATYKYYGDDLFVQSDAPGPTLAPLNLYFNAQTNHHMTTASEVGNAWAQANSYTQVAVQGFVYLSAAAAGPGAQGLEMWYSATRGDHFLVGTAQTRAGAKDAGYVLQYVDCYVGQQWVVWPNVPPTTPSSIPYPASKDLVGYQYLNGANAVTPGIGADTWYPSWASDGKLYSSWTDGTVDGHRSSSGGGDKATTGYAIISGDDPFNLTLSGVDTYVESTKPYQGRYPSLNYYRDGVWYYGTYSLENYGMWPSPAPDCGNWCIQGPFCSIRTSTDEGATWFDSKRNMTSWSDNLFGETAFNNSRVKFGAPHAIDFGQNAQYAPDGRLYIVGHGGESPLTHQSWMQGDSVYMARTVGKPDPATVNTPQAWEFYAGGEGAAATWDAALANAKPLALWMTRGGVTTMSYHPALSKYIMVISTPTVSPSMVGPFDTYFLESDFISGPWAYVAYIPQFGPEAYFVHIPTKFMGTVAPANGATRSAVTGVLPSGSTAPTAQALREEDASQQEGTTAFYNFFLSYSADFASGKPNPPGSGYHWSLLQSRFGVTAAFAEKLAKRKQG